MTRPGATALAGFVATLVIASLAVTARAEERAVEEFVQVTGSASITVPPDAAWLVLYVQAEDVLASDAEQASRKAADAAIKAVSESVGSEAVAVENSDLGIANARGSSLRKGKQPLVSSRRLRFKLRPEAPLAMRALDAGIRAGATTQAPDHEVAALERGIVVYGIEASEELQVRLREAAMKDARTKAESLATLAGRKSGEVVRLEDSAPSIPDANHLVLLAIFDPPGYAPGGKPEYRYVGTDPAGVVIRSSVNVAIRLD